MDAKRAQPPSGLELGYARMGVRSLADPLPITTTDDGMGRIAVLLLAHPQDLATSLFDFSAEADEQSARSDGDLTVRYRSISAMYRRRSH